MLSLSRVPKTLAAFMKASLLMALCFFTSPSHAVTLPDAATDTPLAATSSAQSIVLAGGCFWGVQAVFQHVKGVTQAVSGYAGGGADSATYERVSDGDTGHAESVEVTYDPSKVTLGQLLKVYFAVAHNPTQLNRQGPDQGTQYRSAIFYNTPEQKRVAEAYIAQLQQAKIWNDPIVTQLAPMKAFYKAEAYHQDYARLHPNNPYIAAHDLPKVAHLKQEFPGLYQEAN
jgi:peptide-methionine (S)-S-oxide reductase